MVLHHVADRAGLLVELPASFHPELLGHGDLDPLDVVAVPDRLEEAVGEPEVEEVLHRLLAEVVIDAEDRGLGEELVQRRVERLRPRRGRARTASPPRPGAFGASPTRASPETTVAKQAGRDRQIVERALAPTQRLAQAVVGRRVLVVAAHVAQQPAELAETPPGRRRRAAPRSRAPAARSCSRFQSERATPRTGHVQVAVADHRLQRGKDLLEGEVAGDAEDDQRVRGTSCAIVDS